MRIGKAARRVVSEQAAATYARLKQAADVRALSPDQLTDLRVVCEGFAILDRPPVFDSGLDHVSDIITARTASILSSVLVATCAYYLCCELPAAYEGVGGSCPSAARSLAGQCAALTAGSDGYRYAALATSLSEGILAAGPEAVEAIARALSTCLAQLQGTGDTVVSREDQSRALTAAMYVASERRRNRVVLRLARQLAGIAVSDGYRAIAEFFRARTDGRSAADMLAAVRAADEVAARLSDTDPARDVLAHLARRMADNLIGTIPADRPDLERDMSLGVRLMAEGNPAGAIPLFDRVASRAGPPASAIGALFSFRCAFQAVGFSRDSTCAEVTAVVEKLARHRFAVVRDSLDAAEPLRQSLYYCAARTPDDPGFAWLAVRIADLLGEYCSGAAIGSGYLASRADELAVPQLAVADLLAGQIEVPSAELLRTAARNRTVVWASIVPVETPGGTENCIIAFVLGPHDRYPQLASTVIRSARARQVLGDAIAAALPDSQEVLELLRRWVFQVPVDPGYPLIVVPDRFLWSLPWGAVAPPGVPAVTVMPSLAATVRLAPSRRAARPVVAGVFDVSLAGAAAELQALEELHAQDRLVLRRAATLAGLTEIAAAGDVDLLTIAAHGTSGNGFEYRMMFPDAAASPAGLLGIRMPSSVVLGCCWSARRGERADSLATTVACLSAGASSVAGGLWELDDEVTGQLLPAVYGDFAAGHGLAAVIRAAQLRLPPGQQVRGGALTAVGIA